MMNVVGILNSDNYVFESQSCSTEEQKQTIEEAILKDATGSNLDIRIEYMTNEELDNYIRTH